MKATVVRQAGGPEVMKLEEVPDPKPGAGEVLVRIKAAGVNPVDAYIRSGNYPMALKLPYTPGADGAGTVEAVGSGVNKIKAGDRVYLAGAITGTYAEKALAAESTVHPLPERASFGQGAGVGVPCATAYRALFDRAGARAGETVLVHGASGGVGIAGVQLARAAGMTVFGTAGSERGMKLVKEQGAHQVFNHKDKRYFEQILNATGAKGVDVILEMLANVNLGEDLGLLAKRGRVAVIGSRGPVQIDPRGTMSKDASIVGMTLFNLTGEEYARIHAALAAALESGTLRPIVGEEMPLAEAARAHQKIIEESHSGKIVLVP